MSVVAAGKLFHGGVYAGNATVMAAAEAVLDEILARGESIYAHLGDVGDQLAAGLGEIMTRLSVPHVIQHVGAVVSLFLTHKPVERLGSYRDVAEHCDFEKYIGLQHAVQRRGVYFHPNQFETMFLSTAHSRGRHRHVVGPDRGGSASVSTEVSRGPEPRADPRQGRGLSAARLSTWIGRRSWARPRSAAPGSPGAGDAPRRVAARRPRGDGRGQRAAVSRRAGWRSFRASGSPLLVHAETPPAELKTHRESRSGPGSSSATRGAGGAGGGRLDGDGSGGGGRRGRLAGARSTRPTPLLSQGTTPASAVPLHPTSGTTGQPKLSAPPGPCAVAEAEHYVKRSASIPAT